MQLLPSVSSFNAKGGRGEEVEPGSKPLAAQGVGRRWFPVLDPLMPRVGENESMWYTILDLLLRHAGQEGLLLVPDVGSLAAWRGSCFRMKVFPPAAGIARDVILSGWVGVRAAKVAEQIRDLTVPLGVSLTALHSPTVHALSENTSLPLRVFQAVLQPMRSCLLLGHSSWGGRDRGESCPGICDDPLS